LSEHMNDSKSGNTKAPTNGAEQNGAAGEDTVESLRAKLQEAQANAEKFKNEFLYLRAEFDTSRRNAIKERADLMKYGSERLINEILAVIDNFERALETKVTADNYQSYSKGVEMTAQEMKAALGRFGVTEVNSQGLQFDPAVHEAVGSDESTDVPTGHISKVLRKPYKLHDKLLRPGQVIVSAKKG